MLTSNDIIERAKIILVDNNAFIEDKYTKEIQDFLKDKVYLKVGNNSTKDTYTGSNSHHYTTKYWYSVLPDICGHIGIKYNFNDFNLVENVLEEGDFSYLVPKKNTRYKVTCTPIEYDKERDLFINYIGQNVYECEYKDLVNHDVYCSDVHGPNSPYHKLFIFAHQTVVLENLEDNTNGITLIISGNSHSIPIIPILSYYFKKIILLDNRFLGMRFTRLYENEDSENTESLLMLSYDNNLHKFLEQNL